jgi:hypothetical protein
VFFLDSDAFVRDYSDWLEKLMAEEGMLEPKRNGRNVKDGKAAKLMLVGLRTLV